jgi:hypothetical protein
MEILLLYSRLYLLLSAEKKREERERERGREGESKRARERGPVGSQWRGGRPYCLKKIERERDRE